MTNSDWKDDYISDLKPAKAYNDFIEMAMRTVEDQYLWQESSFVSRNKKENQTILFKPAQCGHEVRFRLKPYLNSPYRYNYYSNGRKNRQGKA